MNFSDGTLQGKDTVASVYILEAPAQIDFPYEYSIPEELRPRISAGVFASVRFGTKPTPIIALVVATSDESRYPKSKLKPLVDIIYPDYRLTAEQLGLCDFLREQTFCTFGEAVRAVVPYTVFPKTAPREPNEFYIVTQAGLEAEQNGAFRRSPAVRSIFEEIKAFPGKDRYSVISAKRDDKARLDRLISDGYIEATEPPKNVKPEKPKHTAGENSLNDCQRKALAELEVLCSTGKPEAALLHGITGSGKTRVIKALADRVLESGRQVIILVPEIALTPQTIGLFSSFYGDDITVIHSSLSAGERRDAFLKIKNGDVSVCIGTRSAVFAPFERLGMIVIDEEQEHTYKSDSDPKYSTVDIARYRCAHNNALMLLSSATPSLQSYYKARAGKYHLVTLNERYGDATLPEAVICDMRDEISRDGIRAIGSRLQAELRRTLDDGKQAIIFINRRGYHNYLTCTSCGAVMMCPHCSVSLTGHIHGEKGDLRCHYCGYRTKIPQTCPQCKSQHMRFVGFGTQYVEAELARLFPDKKVLRMDADTTSTKHSYERILGSFRRHEADILIGTQMVTKGHDFPDVTLSGILLADMTLYLDDYRANERTFSLITQVIGRAGRASFPGKAVIQTYNPDHPVLKLAAEQDYEGFYNNEIAIRRALVFPPICDIILISLASKSEEKLSAAATHFNGLLRSALTEDDTVDLIVFGPFEAPVYRINETYRMRFVSKGRTNLPTRALLRRVLDDFMKSKQSGGVFVSIDVNPTNL